MSENKTDNRKATDCAALVVLILLIFWFCQDILFSAQVPFFRDLGTYFYPMRHSLFESYRAGSLPLWDRHMAMGFPLLADFQSAAFYPPHLVFFVLSFFLAIRAIFIFHFLVAAVGAYSLWRHWNYSPWLSVIGTLLFTLGGTIVSLANLLNHFQTAVWLPWVILLWERALRSTAWKHFLIFTLVSTIQFLAGSPELFALTLALVLIDGLRIRATSSTISFPRVASVFLLANVLVVMLVMVQLLPTLELFLESRRQHVIPYQEALNWSLNPVTLLNLFFLDKEMVPGLPNGIRPLVAQEIPFLVSYYLGAVCIFGLGLWSYYSSRWEKALSLALIVVSLVMAFGAFTPVYPLLYRYVPLLSSLRFPEKFFFLTYCVLLFMAMKGLGSFENAKAWNSRINVFIPALIFLIWASLYGLFQLRSDILSSFVAAKSGSPLFSVAQVKGTATILASLERQVFLTAGLSLLIVLSTMNLIRMSLLGGLLVVVVFVDLTWAHRGLLFPLNPAFVNEGSRIMEHPDPRLSRIFYYPSPHNLHPSSYRAKGQPSFKEASALPFQDLLPNAGILYGFDYMQEIDALARRPYADFLAFANNVDPARQIQLLRMFNVGHLISFEPLSVEGTTLMGRFPQYFSWLYKIDNPIPRTYIVNKVSVEQSSGRVFQRLLAPGFDPAEEVVLDHLVAVASKRPLAAQASIVQYENQRVIVQASLNQPGILILADSYYPGWKAYVNSKEEAIRRANLFFRAVLLPAGTHTVEFRYEPTSFKLGLAISIATIFVISLVSIVCALHSHKKSSSRVVS
jgi:hypothetical protein